MLRELFEKSFAGVLTVPYQRADLVMPFHLARQTQVGVEHGYEPCGVIADHVNYAYNSVLVHHSHLGLYAVEPSFLNRDIVVRTIDGVVDNMGYHEMVA